MCRDANATSLMSGGVHWLGQIGQAKLYRVDKVVNREREGGRYGRRE
jgi:hypothetical protein